MKLSKKVFPDKVGLIIALLFVLVLINYTPGYALPATPINGMVFSDPFGYLGDSPYKPRITIMYGLLIEDTSFGIKNPDLNKPSSCFGVPWDQLWHAGEDLYDSRITTSQGTTSGAEVVAIADGIVKFANDVTWPGSVVVIEHNTGPFSTYSLYGHLRPDSVLVQANDFVVRGQVLGTVEQMGYDGYWPQFHTSGDDSHLHFEIRFFLDASNIYSQPACNGSLLGVGYTYPSHPTVFPYANVVHYTNPTQFIWLNQWHVWTPSFIN
jgi:hypothetical protein